MQQYSPWRCYHHDQFLAGILKKENENVLEENKIALNSNLCENIEEVESEST